MERQLVIDASVARAANGVLNCQEFLEVIRIKRYHIIMSPYIRDEWKYQQSRFAISWRSQMVSMGRMHIINIEINKDLRANIGYASPTHECKEAMLKDAPLIEAALEADETVISLDERVRKMFAYASKHICEIRIIVWVNPAQEIERPLQWLKEGALPEIQRRLEHLFDRRRDRKDSECDLEGFGFFMAEACPI